MPLPPATPLQLGDYAVHTAWEGFASVVHQPSGEIMHSRTDPMEEAHRVYVEQAHLADRLQFPIQRGPLVLWDVGLGAAANAVAAIECHEALVARVGHSAVRPLLIISFENDIDSLRLALSHLDRFPYLKDRGAATLLETGRWKSEADSGVTWELAAGDFTETMSHAPGPPEVIFYDMFSPKTCAPAWMAATFRRLFAICDGSPAALCTYTLSTASRAAMLAAGFWVARGRSAGAKSETTIALTPEAVEEPSITHQLLGAEWLGKWERSKAKHPADVTADERESFEARIRLHPQFGR